MKLSLNWLDSANRKLIGNWKVGRRLTLVVAALLVPAVVASVDVLLIKQEGVKTALLEDYGLEFVNELSDAVIQIAEHRAAVNQYKLGDKEALKRALKEEEQAAKDFGDIEATAAKYGKQIGLEGGQVAGLKAEWEKLKADRDAITAEQSFERHTALLDKLLALNDHVVDSSGLILDPRFETYYLMDALTVKGPRLINYATDLRGISGTMARRGTLDANDRLDLTVRITEVKDLMAGVKTSLGKAFGVDAALRAAIEPDLVAAEKEVAAFIALTSRLARATTGTDGITGEQVFAAGVAAMEAFDRLEGKGSATFKTTLDKVVVDLRREQAITGGLLLLGVLFGVALAAAGVRSVTGPVDNLSVTMQKVQRGDDDARADIHSRDELGLLAYSFNSMLEERIAAQQRIKDDQIRLAQENETLNNSVLGLLQSVAQMAKKDLTVRATVTEDVTGPVADALNMVNTETVKVLQQVSDISADVSQASLKVKAQSDAVQAVADAERIQVEATSDSLIEASNAMTRINDLAQTCNQAADRAIKTTQLALASVTSTVGGIASTRDTIRETEKRIKRLGERSQEISVAVGLINTIAERTHILAINAAMHAASAGEAGRGFAVVADEVQRLAESARQATQQIAALVGNIQVETADTVTTMNSAISQVVEGSRLAEQAGSQMQDTQTTTAELVAAVQRIASQSQEQVAVAKTLIERAESSKQSSIKTNSELAAQSEQTGRLVDYAKNLISAVRVFKLTANA
jgi:methyl-accepting chemotaxis protein